MSSASSVSAGATAQSLMKAIGEIQSAAGAHFVDRPSLLGFSGAMIKAPSVDEALRARLAEAEPVPRPKALQVSLPADLRDAMLPDLPANITLGPGRLEIRAESTEAMLESLVALAMIMTNDLVRFRAVVDSVRGDACPLAITRPDVILIVALYVAINSEVATRLASGFLRGA